MSRLAETAYAKLNLALHVRGKRADGYHAIETIFVFCEDGDELSASEGSPGQFSLETGGEFARELDSQNLVTAAYFSIRAAANVRAGAKFMLEKRLPLAAGVGGGSADAAAALRLATRLWNLDPSFAQQTAPKLGSDVPACLLSQTRRGTGAGEVLEAAELPEISGTTVLLVNPRRQLPTAPVFEQWDGVDRGPLGDWREGRNDLEPAAIALVPEIAEVLAWLRRQPGADLVRMSGSGATCFALFVDEASRDAAASHVPQPWWHLATRLR